MRDTLSRNEQVFSCLFHFLPKKDMILPCPGLAAPFLAAPLAAGAGVGLAFFGAGSSSENDSHAASSRVTVVCQ